MSVQCRAEFSLSFLSLFFFFCGGGGGGGGGGGRERERLCNCDFE